MAASRAITASAFDPTVLTAVTAKGRESWFTDASVRAIVRNLAMADAVTREPVACDWGLHADTMRNAARPAEAAAAVVQAVRFLEFPSIGMVAAPKSAA